MALFSVIYFHTQKKHRRIRSNIIVSQIKIYCLPLDAFGINFGYIEWEKYMFLKKNFPLLGLL